MRPDEKSSTASCETASGWSVTIAAVVKKPFLPMQCTSGVHFKRSSWEFGNAGPREPEDNQPEVKGIKELGVTHAS
jgi:hypothetical protein